jgi:hypothetical protein
MGKSFLSHDRNNLDLTFDLCSFDQTCSADPPEQITVAALRHRLGKKPMSLRGDFRTIQSQLIRLIYLPKFAARQGLSRKFPEERNNGYVGGVGIILLSTFIAFWHFMRKPLYEPGKVRANEASIDLLIQNSSNEPSYWKVESGIKLYHFEEEEGE